MASAVASLCFMNGKGDVLIQRIYKDDVQYVARHASLML